MLRNWIPAFAGIRGMKKDLKISSGLNSGGSFHTYDLISMRPSTVQKVAGS
jgi:hypothetical protein